MRLSRAGMPSKNDDFHEPALAAVSRRQSGFSGDLANSALWSKGAPGEYIPGTSGETPLPVRYAGANSFSSDTRPLLADIWRSLNLVQAAETMRTERASAIANASPVGRNITRRLRTGQVGVMAIFTNRSVHLSCCGNQHAPRRGCIE